MTTTATGRRKLAVAQVRLKEGSGQFLVNGRLLADYFPRLSLQALVQEPLKLTQNEKRLDCSASINGGGISGQAGALRHGLARALLALDGNHRAALRKAGLLTRDFRTHERKKYGQKGARKRFQWTKR
jgi:small subunit ribosomal protein S9